MSRKLAASERKVLIRLASEMEKGSPERRAILSGLSKVAGPHPKDWKPSPLLPSRYEFGADMEGGGASSSFKTDFGTYFHEPADDDAVYFQDLRKSRNYQLLGRGSFNDARDLAVKHHQKFLNPRPVRPRDYAEDLAAAVLRKRTTPKMQKPLSGPGSRSGGWMEYPNGRTLQFDLRGSSSPHMLVMEVMGAEWEPDGGPYEEDAVDIPTTGNLKRDSATVVGHILTFAKKHRDILKSTTTS